MRFEIIILAATGAFVMSCGGGSEGSPESYLSIVDDSVAVGVSIESAVGAGKISIPVRTVNSHGAAVAGLNPLSRLPPRASVLLIGSASGVALGLALRMLRIFNSGEGY
jgi:hypothetical protein